MNPETKYEELSGYIRRGAHRIASENIGEGVQGHRKKREELAHRIVGFITDVRMLDREISLEAQEAWRDLPVIT